MEYVSQFVWMLGHIKETLEMLVASYGTWTYLVLFLVIFCETGLVVTPFLPGDSLLFILGAFCGAGSLDPLATIGLLTAAAILGDNTNYWIGRTLGPAVFKREDSWLLNKKHLEKTHAFYEKHGGKTVVIARFMPIVRTFAPFVAGIGNMHYPRFLAFSVGGGILWIGGLVGLGYLVGDLPLVKQNFNKVIYLIIALSLMPGVIEFLKARRAAARAVR
ncbi:putative membrane protein [Fundidesulfovibrio magnetotacticus]|uniref:Putative membrane protein n=1 Tax=Fundidesulfovibrio magnetotacticus TaxID=2730080 RepID=A0A6V8LZ54_9BACT|nr:DedA family protein [Fundidesulfovibrio magnetotacticus]GFK94927.1 putative membrane protein [Fundidesulfovibrio magnetotacticus]